MFTKTIEYEDYDGNVRKEPFYFNLNKAELMEMQFTGPGGLEKKLKTIINSLDGEEMMKTFKEIILKSYGEKSLDGKRFIKKAPDGHLLANDFEQTEAYSQLFMELVIDADKMAEFINGIIPASLAAEIDKEIESRGGDIQAIVAEEVLK